MADDDETLLHVAKPRPHLPGYIHLPARRECDRIRRCTRCSEQVFAFEAPSEDAPPVRPSLFRPPTAARSECL